MSHTEIRVALLVLSMNSVIVAETGESAPVLLSFLSYLYTTFLDMQGKTVLIQGLATTSGFWLCQELRMAFLVFHVAVVLGWSGQSDDEFVQRSQSTAVPSPCCVLPTPPVEGVGVSGRESPSSWLCWCWE